MALKSSFCTFALLLVVLHKSTERRRFLWLYECATAFLYGLGEGVDQWFKRADRHHSCFTSVTGHSQQLEGNEKWSTTIHQALQEFSSIIRHFQQRTVNLSEVCTVGGLAWLTGRASGPLRTSSSTYQHCRFYKPPHLSTDSALCSILISPKFHPGERASRLLWTSRLQPSVDLETFDYSVGRFYTSQFVDFIHCSLLISTWFHPWEGHRTCFWKVVLQGLKKCSDIIWVRVTFLRK